MRVSIDVYRDRGRFSVAVGRPSEVGASLQSVGTWSEALRVAAGAAGAGATVRVRVLARDGRGRVRQVTAYPVQLPRGREGA